MEEHAFAIERLALTEHLPMHGTVTISVPPVLANNFYANHLYAFAQMHPGIRLSMASQAQSVSLARREADIAVRLFRPEEPQNVTRKLGEMAFSLYASRDYAHASTPDDWAFICYDAQFAEMPHQKWLESIARGRRIACEVSDITTQQVAPVPESASRACPCSWAMTIRGCSACRSTGNRTPATSGWSCMPISGIPRRFARRSTSSPT